MSACVPMTTCASPVAAISRARLRAAAGSLPVSSAQEMPKGSSSRVAVRKCWAASTSVGAIIAP